MGGGCVILGWDVVGLYWGVKWLCYIGMGGGCVILGCEVVVL